jgi:hypothetical protein
LIEDQAPGGAADAGTRRLIGAGCCGIAVLAAAVGALLVMGVRSSSLHSRDSEIIANHFIDTIHDNDPEAAYLLATPAFKRLTPQARLAADYARIARAAGLLGARSDHPSIESDSAILWHYAINGTKQRVRADVRVRRDRGVWRVDGWGYTLER